MYGHSQLSEVHDLTALIGEATTRLMSHTNKLSASVNLADDLYGHKRKGCLELTLTRAAALRKVSYSMDL